MDATESEIYHNAPIEFVACEVQFPVSPSLATDDALRALHGALFMLGPVVQQPPLTSQHLRFLSRDRRLCVVVSPRRVSVETTAYPGWREFRVAIEKALAAAARVEAAIPGLTRVGLRYIDEVRVSDPGSGENRWTRYIDPRLSGGAAVSLEGKPPADMQAALQFDLGEGYAAVVRYGARHGQAVGDAPLRRRRTYDPSSDYFLFDIDSFWQAPADSLPEFSVEATVAIANRLHEPVRALFESSITDDLRDVLRREPSDG